MAAAAVAALAQRLHLALLAAANTAEQSSCVSCFVRNSSAKSSVQLLRCDCQTVSTKSHFNREL